MSTQTPDERLRAIRARIWRLMLELPYRIASGVNIAAVPVSNFMGRYRVHDQDVEAEIRVYDPETGETVSPAVPAPWTPTEIKAEDFDELISKYMMQRYDRYAIIRVVYGDGREYRVKMDVMPDVCWIVGELSTSRIIEAVPGEYPLDRPATLRASGVMFQYRGYVSEEFAMLLDIVVGTVGWKSNGKWVQWDGILTMLVTGGASSVNGVRIYTPWGVHIVENEDAWYASLRTPFAQITIQEFYVQTCESAAGGGSGASPG